MSFTYSAASTSKSTRDRARLLMGDTNSASYAFEDEEIDDLLALNDSDPQLAAAAGLRVIAADKAKMALRFSVTGFSFDRTAASKQLLDTAKALEDSASSAPFEYESVVESYIDTAGRDRSSYFDTPP